LASSEVEAEFINFAHYVDVEAMSVPKWLEPAKKGKNIQWAGERSDGRSSSPHIVVLNNNGDYHCTVIGGLNSRRHALNVIRELKALRGELKPATSQTQCPGATV
jgi:hypothetical protein